ncbi:hypothetical protein ED312_12415 [Sinomicrobium pectinilyticum]|uniref:Uncharacterized protein n=1 Tax=Sinomicrobium pectinilyticum TaxID=1084421 RepID=A0A3N0ECU3_SINP1|nr:hypothetical protein ED312_12415 [Sinomicrobium pectinilyticum]
MIINNSRKATFCQKTNKYIKLRQLDQKSGRLTRDKRILKPELFGANPLLGPEFGVETTLPDKSP